MNKLNWETSAKTLIGIAIFSLLYTIEGAYEIIGISHTLMIVLLGIGVSALAIYFSIKTLKAIKEYERILEKSFSFTEGISLKWVNYISIYYLLFLFGFVIDSISTISGFMHLYMVGFVSTLGFAFIRNFIHYNSIYKNLHLKETKQTSPDSDIKIKIESAESKEEELFKLITEVINSKELYLNESLTLNDLARELGVNYKYITNAINDSSGKSFLEFINEYRTKKAEQLLLDNDNVNLPLDVIGNLSGFKSKATFYKYFKAHFGQTPSAYKKSKSIR